MSAAVHTTAFDANRSRREVLTIQCYAAADPGSTQLSGRHTIEKLLLPMVILGVAGAKGEYGVGQLTALPVARVDPDQHRTVVAAFNFAGIKWRGVHGGGIYPKTVSQF
jgi:hypothetical protein